MPTAIEQIVSVFVALGNRRKLEDIKLERQRAMAELQGQSGVSAPIRQIENEIAVIEAGLEKLSAQDAAAPPAGSILIRSADTAFD